MSNSRYLKNFIEKAQKIHNNVYDYSLSEWNGTGVKITIICKIHGVFQQLATSHIHKKCSCPKCGIIKRINTQKLTITKFIERSRQIHNDKYDYSNVDYIGANIKIKIICPLHGIFLQTPSKHINNERGCQKCGGTQKLTNEEFLKNAKKVHQNKYNYNLAKYVSAHTLIKITCKIHGEFSQSYAKHVNLKQGCPKCSGQGIWCYEYFVQKAKETHGNKYLYEFQKDLITGCEVSIPITCKKHGIFNQRASSHINGRGCTMCGKATRCSNNQLLWINWMMIRYNIDIQHYFNGGEYSIIKSNNTRFYVDGYCKKTNMIFEYNGSYYHGDPRVFEHNHINKKLKIRFSKLFNETLFKENFLISKGYYVVSMWEYDFNKILKSIKLIQQVWRKKLLSNND